jgi:hypothetical protein
MTMRHTFGAINCSQRSFRLNNKSSAKCAGSSKWGSKRSRNASGFAKNSRNRDKNRRRSFKNKSDSWKHRSERSSKDRESKNKLDRLPNSNWVSLKTATSDCSNWRSKAINKKDCTCRRRKQKWTCCKKSAKSKKSSKSTMISNLERRNIDN